MHRYGLLANYLQFKDKDQNKGATLYIDRRPKATRNTVGFINNTQPRSTLNQTTAYLRGMEEIVYLYVPLKQYMEGKSCLLITI